MLKALHRSVEDRSCKLEWCVVVLVVGYVSLWHGKHLDKRAVITCGEDVAASSCRVGSRAVISHIIGGDVETACTTAGCAAAIEVLSGTVDLPSSACNTRVLLISKSCTVNKRFGLHQIVHCFIGSIDVLAPGFAHVDCNAHGIIGPYTTDISDSLRLWVA